MKKILISFLIMTMIAGCVQKPTNAEKPADVPMVEQEKPEETEVVKKIDESKDWVYIKENLQIDFKYEWDYPTYFNIEKAEYMQIQIPVFNVDTDEIKTLNKTIEELQKQRYEHIKYRTDYFSEEDKIIEEYTKTFTNIYLSDNYATIMLSVFELTNQMNVSYEHYTVNLKTGKVINNQDLLKDFDIDLDTLEDKIQSELLKTDYQECNGELFNGYPASQTCYLMDKLYPLPENAILYVNSDNQLIYNTMNRMYFTDGTLGAYFVPINISSSEDTLLDKKSEKNVEVQGIDKILRITNEPLDIQLTVDRYKDQLFIQEPTLLWDSEDALQFNSKMSQLAQTCRNELTYHENGYWHTASLLNTNYYINDDILSIIVKLDRLLADAGVGPSEFMTYNFSLTTHKQLSNAEILEAYHVSPTAIQEGLNKQLEKDYLPCSAPVNEDGLIEKPCYGEYAGGTGGKYGDTSLIYIKDKMIHMYVHVNQAVYQENVDLIVYNLNEAGKGSASDKEMASDNELKSDYVKKINETKDWVYINDIHVSDMDYAYIDMKQMILDSEYKAGNELENWYNTIVTYTPEIQNFTINIDSQDANRINSWIQEQVHLKLSDPKSKGEHIFKVKSFVNEEILSVLIRSCLFLPGSGWNDETYIYNFDLTTGKALANDELVERFELDNSQVKDILKHIFDENDQIACDYPTSQQFCYNWQDYYVNDINRNYIFIVNGQLNILWQILDEQGFGYYKQIVLV